MKKLLVIAHEGEVNPATRLRILQYLPGLEEGGFTARTFFVTSGGAPLSRQRHEELEREFAGADIIFIQRVLAPWLNQLVERSGKPTVFDMDDALHYIRQSQFAAADNPKTPRQYLTNLYRQFFRGGKYFSSNKKLLERMLHLCTVAIVGNRWLYRELSPLQKDMVVLPTAVPVEEYPHKIHAQVTPVRIGWIGVRSNLFHLTLLDDVFASLTRRFGSGVLLTVVSNQEYRSDAIATEYIEWSLDRESSIVGTFDIGIMPLQDDFFSRGKCSFKAIYCMAHGVPVVISPVGMNTELVRSGENGYLASSKEEWVEGIATLVENLSLREKLGKGAVTTIENEYSSGKVLLGLKEIFSRLSEINSSVQGS